jgi:hypothetical protein
VPAKPGERAGLSLRVSAQTKQKLEEAAEKSGRSISAEAELLIELALDRQAMASQFAVGWEDIRATIEAFGDLTPRKAAPTASPKARRTSRPRAR